MCTLFEVIFDEYENSSKRKSHIHVKFLGFESNALWKNSCKVNRKNFKGKIHFNWYKSKEFLYWNSMHGFETKKVKFSCASWTPLLLFLQQNLHVITNFLLSHLLNFSHSASLTLPWLLMWELHEWDRK